MNNVATLPAQKKYKRERVHLRVIKGGFAPADKYAESMLRVKKLRVGDVVKADIVKLRNTKFNRLVHKLGILVTQNIEAFSGLDAHKAIKRLQIEGKIECDEIGIFLPGYGMVIQFIPRSLSFDSMDETEFNKAAKQISRLISERYWPSLDADQIESMASCMVDE